MTDICAEKHKRVDERLDANERRLDDHDDRIDNLEKYQSRAEVQVKNLCKQIESLVKAIWWAISITITSLLGFFIWYIQNIRR